jgi:hypothetical protein
MIDALAGEVHFEHHIRPIWDALPEEIRGTFYRRSFAMRPGPNPVITAAAGDMKRARAMGRPVALMEHGCGQSFGGDPRSDKFPSYAGNSGRGGVGLFLHPGEHPAARDRKRYPDARIEVVGCPKLDSLPRKEGPRRSPPVVAVSFHWKCTLCPETDNAWDAFKGQVAELTKTYEVIGHGHPRIISRLRTFYQRMGIETVGYFGDVCARADVYVNDASSTLFEFAATGRPVVVMNPKKYRRDINHGLRFWDAASVGVNVEEGGNLTEAVALAIEDTPGQRTSREDALDLVYAHRTGAAQRAVDALVDWAGELAVAA